MKDSLRITYTGHATVFIEMDGVRLLTDPLLRDRVAHLRRQNAPIDLSSYQDIDAVLISHLHMDHLDIPSLQLLGNTPRLVVPHGTAAFLEKKGFQNIEEMRVGETQTIKGLTIRSTHAEHARTRYPLGPSADSMGFVIRGEYGIYYAGDTKLFPEMKNLANNLDLALLPVWGWGPKLGKRHLGPYRAAQALTMLNPRTAIPIHWGTLCPLGMGWMDPPFLKRPPHAFARHAVRLAPHVRIRVVTPGSSISLNGGKSHAFL